MEAVRLVPTGLRFDAAAASLLHVDDAAGLLLAVAGGAVAAYSLAQPGAPPRVTALEPGPRVAAVRCSPDGRWLALQRAPAYLELVERDSGRLLLAAPARRGAHLVGFFWTAAPGADLVMATPAGLEAHALGAGGRGLALRSQLAHPTRWVRYDHGSRVALLGTGEQGLWLQGYQFAADGVAKLPPFQIAAASPGATPAPPAASRLDPACVRLLTLYGRPYCAFADRPGRRLLLYRLFRDAVVLARSVDAGAPDFELGVADNLLLLHQPAARRVLLLDVAAPGGPPGPALPLGLAAPAGGPRPDILPAQPGAGRADGFCLPNLVLDAAAGVGWAAALDLRALAAGARDPAALVALLQRRRPEAHPGADLRALTLSVVRGVLVERPPLAAVRAVFDAAAAAAAEAVRAAPLPPVDGGAPGAPAGDGGADIVAEALQWLHEEEAVPAPYLQACLDAYGAAAEAAGVGAPACLARLALDVALQQGHGLQAAAALLAQPDRASPGAADALEAAAEAGGAPGGGAAADALRARLGLHALRVRAALRRGRVVRALRLARAHRVESLPPAAFLHAAAESGARGRPPAPAAVAAAACRRPADAAPRAQATWASSSPPTASATSPCGRRCRTMRPCSRSTSASCRRPRPSPRLRGPALEVVRPCGLSWAAVQLFQAGELCSAGTPCGAGRLAPHGACAGVRR